MKAEDVWYGRSLGPGVLRGLLVPLSGLYWFGWQLYLALYKKGLKKAKEPHRPVLCVGNLTVGGSGKSPTTLHVAKALRSLGRDVVISASGYGSPASQEATIAPDGELSASRWGDEPAMIRWLLPGIPLIVGRDRVAAARLCHERFPKAVMLMDDGLQHLPLRKHAKIVLVDSEARNRFVLPAGPYREPPSNLPKSAAIVEVGKGGYAPYRLTYSTMTFVDRHGNAVPKPDGAAAVLCAIAKPTRFVAALQGAGVEVRVEKLLPDHDPLAAGNLLDGLHIDLPLVVTAKDWVKLRERDDLGDRKIVVALRDGTIEPAADFQQWLQTKLDELEKKGT